MNVLNYFSDRISKLTRRSSEFSTDIFITGLGQLFVMIFALVINKVLSTRLSPAEYTVFSIASRSSIVIGYVMLLGLGIALPKYLAEFKAKQDKSGEANFYVSATLLLLSSISCISALLYLFRSNLTLLLFNDPNRVGLILPIVLFAAGTTLLTYSYSYYRGVGMFKKFNIIQILAQAATLLIVILTYNNIMRQLQLRGILIGSFSLLVILRIILGLKATANLEIKIIGKKIRGLLTYCLPRVPGELFLFSFNVVPLILINYKFGPAAASAVAVAIAMTSFILPIFQLVGTVLLPYVSKNIVNKNLIEIDSKISKLSIIFTLISLATILVITLFSKFAISVLFADMYIPYSSIVNIVFISVLPNSIYLLLRNPIDAVSNVPYNTINLGISLGCSLVFIYVSPTLLVSSFAFLASYSILAMFTIISWNRIKKSHLHQNA